MPPFSGQYRLLLLIVLSLFCACGPLAGQSPMRPSDRAALATALAAYDQGKAQQAEPALRDLAARYPRNYEVNEALGGLYAEADDFARALPFLEHACVLAPKEGLAHANLGAAYLKMARTPNAVHELQVAAKLDPRNGPTQANLGRALMLAGQTQAAAEAFGAAAALAPGDADLHYNEAIALDESGSPKEAAAVLDTIAPAAMTAEMHALAGETEERAGAFEKALRHFEAAARQSPTDANLYAVTTELLRHWNWDEAIKIADFGAEKYPSSTHFKMASGIAYYGKSDYAPAVEIFSSLLQADPNNAGVADLLGRSCAALKDGENAGCGAVYDFAQHHPANAVMTTYAAIAILHEPADKQDLAEAASLLQKAIAADPKYAEAYLQMGVLEQMRLHWAESATLLEHAVALNPTAAETHYRLSRAYAHLGRREEAQAQIALHQTYSEQAKHALDGRLQEVMRFILNPS